MVFLSVVIHFASVQFCFFLFVFFCICAVSNWSFTVAVSCSQCLIRWLCTEDRDVLDGRRCEASNERSRPVLSVPAGEKRCASRMCASVCVCSVYVQLCIFDPDV